MLNGSYFQVDNRYRREYELQIENLWPLSPRKETCMPASVQQIGTPEQRASSVKVICNFPAALVKKADEVAKAEGSNRSELMRRAVEHYVKIRERHKRERELASAYTANSQLASQLVEQFSILGSSHQSDKR
jgi:hypothetical protein